MTERPIISLLTDFGLNGAVAACRGVMLGICRDAQIVDVGHDIRKYAIRDGAFLLRLRSRTFPSASTSAWSTPGSAPRDGRSPSAAGEATC